MTRPLRSAGPALAVVLATVLPLTGCGGGQSVSLGKATTVGASGGPAGGSSSASPTATGAVDGVPQLSDLDPDLQADLRAAFPPFPPVAIPDVTALTGADRRFAGPLASLATPTSGVSVVGARCDTSGKVVNRGSLTMVNNGDGSGAYSDGSLDVKVNGDGSGVYRDGALRIAINGDGSGRLTDGSLRITLNGDGSGRYEDGALTVILDGDGSGRLSDGSLRVTVNGDGSGRYEDGALTEVNNGDGTGTFQDGAVSVVNRGDGTATYDIGADSGTVRMPPLAPVADLGRFPSVRSLVPVGKACGTLIRLSSGVLFDFDQDTLRPEAGDVLDAVAKTLRGVTVPIRVDGFTDAKGTDAYNLDLSRRRAQAVAAALVERGVRTRITATGWGETRAVAPNTKDGKDYPAGRALNRRVEIVVPPIAG